jgi:hypothetical protein
MAYVVGSYIVGWGATPKAGAINQITVESVAQTFVCATKQIASKIKAMPVA